MAHFFFSCLFQRDESNFVQLLFLHCDSFLPSLSPSLLSIPVVSRGDEKEGNSWKRSTRQPSLASLSSSINRNTERIGKERIEGATRVRGCTIASHDLCVLLTTPRTVTPPLPLCFETSALQLLVTNHESCLLYTSPRGVRIEKGRREISVSAADLYPARVKKKKVGNKTPPFRISNSPLPAILFAPSLVN